MSNLDPRPLYPFGHGIGYSSYEVSDLTLDATQVPADGTLAVGVTVRNTGNRDGAEVVQLYLADQVAQVARPIKQLIGFAKVPLPAGDARRVTFDVHMDRTSFTGIDFRRIVEEGRVLTTPVQITDL